MFNHLPKPFAPGSVIPSNSSDGGWHFTFRDATDQNHSWRLDDLPTAVIAKQKMREFVAQNQG